MPDPAPRVAFDTNVLFYSVDGRDRSKQQRCAGLLAAAMDRGLGAVPVQSLGEFSSAVVRKNVLTRQEAASAARDWATIFAPVTASPAAYDLALDWWSEERLAFWDALLVATVSKAAVTALVSEDMNDGAVFAAVEIINPFTQELGARLSAHGFEL